MRDLFFSSAETGRGSKSPKICEIGTVGDCFLRVLRGVFFLVDCYGTERPINTGPRPIFATSCKLSI